MLSCVSSSLNKSSLRPIFGTLFSRYLYLTNENNAARKGTREKARKKKVKVEVQKIGFIPHNQRGKDKLSLVKVNKHVDDSWKAIATDNVYVGKYYRWKVYSIKEAIGCHRETHHPSMYNVPNAPVNIEIEINMQGEKANRFVDNFQRMAMIPHKFNHGEERKLIVFAKGQENLNEALEAGAALVGGPELVKDIQSGELNLPDYHYFIAHPNVLPDLVAVRGLMKKKFPNPKNGTLGQNLSEMVKKFLDGIHYNVIKDENQQDFGLIKTSIGTLDMDPEHLEINLVSLMKDVNSVRPKREGKFITRVLIKSPPSPEQLKIDPFLYVPEFNVDVKKGNTSLDDEIEEELRKKDAN